MVLFILAWVPFFDLGMDWETQVVSIRDSEFPVKVWSYLTFSEPAMWFGGRVSSVSFPQEGHLNNPDLFASLFFWLMSSLPIGLRFNLLLYTVMILNIAAGSFLVHQFEVSWWKSLMAGVFLAWQPLLLSYGFASNITDLTHLWPYAFGLGFLQRGVLESHAADGRIAGLCFAIGFLTCPYNFVLFIPILPMLVYWLTRTQVSWKETLWNVSLGAGILLVLYGAWVGYVMNQADSLVAADTVESVRHAYPFDGLRGDKETRFTAFLMEMFGVFPRPMIIMEQVARFSRHFQWGVVGCLCVLVGAWKAEGFRWFAIVALLIGIGTSMGPFATVNPFTEFSGPFNPIYWWSYSLPLGKMILEPFRYVLVAGLFMTPLIGIGLHKMGKFGWLMSVLMLGEIGFRSPQFILPVETIAWDDRMTDINLPSGGVVHFPFFVSKTNRFDRKHFLYQLQHGHPIADPIMGFPAPYMVENAVLCALIHVETVQFPMEAFQCNRESFRKGWKELQTSGVGSIVFQPELYDEGDWRGVQSIVEKLPVAFKEVDGLFILEIATTP